MIKLLIVFMLMAGIISTAGAAPMGHAHHAVHHHGHHHHHHHAAAPGEEQKH